MPFPLPKKLRASSRSMLAANEGSVRDRVVLVADFIKRQSDFFPGLGSLWNRFYGKVAVPVHESNRFPFVVGEPVLDEHLVVACQEMDALRTNIPSYLKKAWEKSNGSSLEKVLQLESEINDYKTEARKLLLRSLRTRGTAGSHSRPKKDFELKKYGKLKPYHAVRQFLDQESGHFPIRLEKWWAKHRAGLVRLESNVPANVRATRKETIAPSLTSDSRAEFELTNSCVRIFRLMDDIRVELYRAYENRFDEIRASGHLGTAHQKEFEIDLLKQKVRQQIGQLAE